jgi:ABC-type nitrate/sulfonate/bicarbonate transport system permease component
MMRILTVFWKWAGYYYPVLLFGLCWQAVSSAGIVGEDVLPRLDLVLASLWTGLKDGELLGHSVVSSFRVVAGIVAGVVLGVGLGFLTGLSRRWDAYLMPLIVGSQAFPRSALLPLFIVWLGLGEMQKLVVIVSVAFFPIMMNTYEGLKRVNETHLWAARSMGYGEWEILRLVRIPSVLPYLFSGVRISIPMSITMMVVAEMIGARAGLGQFVILTGQTYLLAEMFAGIILLGIIGVLLDQVVEYLARVATPWRESASER